MAREKGGAEQLTQCLCRANLSLPRSGSVISAGHAGQCGALQRCVVLMLALQPCCAHRSLYLSVSWATITLELPLAYVRLVGYPSLTCSAIGRLSEHSKPTRLSTPHALSRSFNSSSNPTCILACGVPLSNLNGQTSEIQALRDCVTTQLCHNLHSVTAVHCFNLCTTQLSLQWGCNRQPLSNAGSLSSPRSLQRNTCPFTRPRTHIM